MCLISVCKKGTIKYSQAVTDFIKSGFACNTDGSGFMFKRHGETTITVEKGFFDVNCLLESIEKYKLKEEDELVIHHRIGTSGKVIPENTHPFVISKKHSEVAALHIVTEKPCLVHNGYFSKLTYYMDLDKDYSDTYAFSRYIMSNPFVLDLLDKDEKLFETLTDSIISTSKVAILYSDKDIKLIGHFIETDGYYHSNSGYCRQNTSGYGGYDHESFSEGFAYNHSVDKNWEDWYEKRRLAAIERNSHNRLLLESPAVTRNSHNRSYEVNNATNQVTEKHRLALRLDNSTINITNKNCHHFQFLLKKDYEFYKASNFDANLGITDNFDPSSLTTALRYPNSINIGPREYQLARSTKTLLEDCYYIPKLSYYPAYKQLLQLAVEVSDPGKKTYKKLAKMLSKPINVMIDNDVVMYWERTKKFYVKRALMLYRDLLKKEIEWKEAQEAKGNKPVTPTIVSHIAEQDTPEIRAIHDDDIEEAIILNMH